MNIVLKKKIRFKTSPIISNTINGLVNQFFKRYGGKNMICNENIYAWKGSENVLPVKRAL
jgi:hypothetical protein